MVIWRKKLDRVTRGFCSKRERTLGLQIEEKSLWVEASFKIVQEVRLVNDEA